MVEYESFQVFYLFSLISSKKFHQEADDVIPVASGRSEAPVRSGGGYSVWESCQGLRDGIPSFFGRLHIR